MNKYTKEDLADNKFQIKVGELKELIEKHNIPDDAIIMYQRINDSYFTKHNWKVYLNKGMFYHQQVELDRKVDLGEVNLEKATPEFLDLMCEQMILAENAWYNKEVNALMITAHI